MQDGNSSQNSKDMLKGQRDDDNHNVLTAKSDVGQEEEEAKSTDSEATHGDEAEEHTSNDEDGDDGPARRRQRLLPP
jgi:hypothetical protein